MKWLPLLLILAACGNISAYEPKLSSPPANGEKYKSDLAECRVHAQNRDGLSVGQTAAVGGLGVVGLLGAAAVADNEDPAFMTGYEIIDRCMAKKGHPVQHVTHCC